MERRLPDLSSRLGEVLQGLKKAKRRREEQHQRRAARSLEEREKQSRGEGQGQALGAGPGFGSGSWEDRQGLSRRDVAASPRGAGAAVASWSGRSSIPGPHVLVSYGRRLEGAGTGAAPDEGRLSAAAGQLAEEADSRSGEASGAGPWGEGVGGSGEAWRRGLGRGEQGQGTASQPMAPQGGFRRHESGSALRSWQPSEAPNAAQAQDPRSPEAEDESLSQWQSWRGEALCAAPLRLRAPHLPASSSGGGAEDQSVRAWQRQQKWGLSGLREAGSAGAGEGDSCNDQATDGTVAPARPPRSLHISPMSVGSFAPVARCLSGADMMACLQALSSAVDTGNTAQVRRLEREIRFASSPIGNAVQRMGLLFLRGLKLRASLGTQDTAAPQLNAQLSTSSPKITPPAMAALASYSKRVPLSKIVLASACAALLDAFSDRRRIHFLCLGYNQMVGCHHWVSLIQGLGTRPQGPPRALRFTFVACTYAMAVTEIRALRHWMKGVGGQLEAEAGRWGIGSFNVECVEIGDAGLQELAAVCGRTAPGTERRRTSGGTPPVVKGEARSTASGSGSGSRSGSAGAGSGAEPGDSPRPRAYPGPTHGPAPAQVAAAAEHTFSEGSRLSSDQGGLLAHPGSGTHRAGALVHLGYTVKGGAPGAGAEAVSGEQEGLCVCTLMSLFNLVDDARLSPNPRQAVMEWVRDLAPDLFLVAEMPVDQASSSPGARFQQCVQYYAPLLDLHDAVMKQERGQGQGQGGARGSGAGGGGGGEGGTAEEQEGIFHFEQCFLGRHVNKCIAPMREKIIHTQSVEAWQAHLARLGYAEALWEAPTQDFVRRCLQGLPSDLHLRFSGGLVTFLWRGQVLYFVGKWGLPCA